MNFKNTFYFILWGAVALFLLPSCGSDDSSIEEVMQTCSDGIQNQDETGVDCGGVCELCGPPTSGNYFYALIDGEEVVVAGTNGSGAGGCNNYTINGGGWLTDPLSNPDDLSAGVFLVQFFNDAPSETELYEMFAEGTYSFGSCDEGMNGAEIEWLDDNGISWQSEEGSQTGSSLTVTSQGAKNGVQATIEGTFNCQLYNDDGDMKVVENGAFRLSLSLF